MSLIGIMGAMQEEVEPLLKALDSYETEQIGNNAFHIGTYKGKKVVVAYSRIGKVNSAVTTTVMIERFGINKLLFTGVAGALNPTLKIGDILYATKLVQHDVDITAFGHKMGFIPETGDFFATDQALNALAEKVAKESGIKLTNGVIATGDQFVANEETKNLIVQHFNADAVEMEGASVACVCASLGVPFFVLRAISDAADMDAGFSFDEFLKSSADISAKFVLKMVEEL